MRYAGEGNGNPLQYSCLENPRDGGAWQAAVHGVAKSRTWLTGFTLIFTFMHWRRKWQPTPLLLPGESHGQRSLVGCRLWGRTESDTTERLHFHFTFSCIGEGNGSPLQCSCLENPRDRGAWWAAVYGVAQNWTLLKQLSSHLPEMLTFCMTRLYGRERTGYVDSPIFNYHTGWK